MAPIIALLLLLAPGLAAAADIALIGTIGDKAAILALDGGDPKTVKVGQRWNGITIISVERERATIEVDGKRRLLQRGQHYRKAEAPAAGRQSVTLSADPQGHFISEGAVNGMLVRFMVDTGASVVAMSAADANRLGLDYRKGRLVPVATANGTARGYLVRLDTVRLGGVELSNVEAIVGEQPMPYMLLGMSFLNRLEMRRDGDTMTLTRRF